MNGRTDGQSLLYIRESAIEEIVEIQELPDPIYTFKLVVLNYDIHSFFFISAVAFIVSAIFNVFIVVFVVVPRILMSIPYNLPLRRRGFD